MAYRKTAALPVEQSSPLTGATHEDKNHAYRGMFWGWALIIYAIPAGFMIIFMFIGILQFLFGLFDGN